MNDMMTMILFHVACAIAGYVYAVAAEWVVHRYVFHVLGKKKGSPFQFHWKDHHRAAHKHEGGDPAFEGSVFSWNAFGREFWGIIAGIIIHSPLLLVAPAAWIAMSLAGLNYHRCHRKSHLDIEWCKEKLPWHWDHHMGDAETADANWCVTCEWFDKLMGTRVPYIPKEERATVPAGE